MPHDNDIAADVANNSAADIAGGRPAPAEPFKIGDSVREKASGRRATVHEVFTSDIPGLEHECAVACKIEDGDKNPVFMFEASELERV